MTISITGDHGHSGIFYGIQTLIQLHLPLMLPLYQNGSNGPVDPRL